MQLEGIHHLTAISADAPGNRRFYEGVLGMRLVKKTVNQDDVSAYHLFYADGLASPGTDITFFDWPAAPERRGTHSIARTALRVDGAKTLDWWKEHLAEHRVKHGEIAERDGRLTLDLEDPEGQRLSLVDDGGAGEAHPWAKSPVPAGAPDPRARADHAERPRSRADRRGADRRHEHAPGPHLSASGERRSTRCTSTRWARAVRRPSCTSRCSRTFPAARQGRGGVHHVAFRTPDAEYGAWAERLKAMRIPNSGKVDRFYFKSLYFREPNGILFEIASDGPGFAADEPLETLGEKLALPPFLESRRAEIEAGLRPV